METTDIVAQHQALLETLRKNIPAPSPAGVSAVLSAGAAQAEIIRGRIATLEQQKAASAQRFDAAIEHHKSILAALQAGPAVATSSILQRPDAAGTENAPGANDPGRTPRPPESPPR